MSASGSLPLQLEAEILREADEQERRVTHLREALEAIDGSVPVRPRAEGVAFIWELASRKAKP